MFTRLKDLHGQIYSPGLVLGGKDPGPPATEKEQNSLRNFSKDFIVDTGHREVVMYSFLVNVLASFIQITIGKCLGKSL